MILITRLNMVLFVFMAQRGWTERCVTFAQSCWGIVVSHSYSWAPLWSNFACQTLQNKRKICSVGKQLQPNFLPPFLLLGITICIFYLSLQIFFKVINTKHLIAEQANIGFYCITRVTIFFFFFFSLAFGFFNLTIFYHTSNPVAQGSQRSTQIY